MVDGQTNRNKTKGQGQFAVFDIDGTLIRWQLYHSIFDHLAKQDLIDTDLYQSVKAARLSWKKRKSGFREYELALVRAYDKTLEYLTREQLNMAIEETFEEYKEQVYTYTRDLIAELKNKGYILLAISGSHNDIVGRIAKHYGFDDWVGTIYHQQNGKFTGEYTIPALKKDQALQDFISKHKLSTKDSIGVGDSEGDILMLELVENPIAFNPEQRLFNHARQKGWKVVIERKNMIYELENKEGKYELA